MIEIQAELRAGPLEEWLKVTPQRIRAGMNRALRRTGTAVQGTAVEVFRSRGIGRRIFGRKAAGARKIITRSKLRGDPDFVIQPVKLKGLAAIQEAGGVTRPHLIRPKNKKRLAINGKPIMGSVLHPGSRMPAMPIGSRAIDRNTDRFATEMAKELQRATGATG